MISDDLTIGGVGTAARPCSMWGRELTRPASTRRSVPDIGLGRLLRDANLAFNRALRRELGKHGCTFSQYQHLYQLWQNDGLAQVELSRRVGIEMASSTAVISQLERRKLIKRSRDPQDRRRIIVVLTPAGSALEKLLNGCARRINSAARANIPLAEMAALFGTAEMITRNLRTAGPGVARRRAPRA
jgi:MarR family transcriptional regulator for hemolysin